MAAPGLAPRESECGASVPNRCVPAGLPDLALKPLPSHSAHVPAAGLPVPGLLQSGEPATPGCLHIMAAALAHTLLSFPLYHRASLPRASPASIYPPHPSQAHILKCKLDHIVLLMKIQYESSKLLGLHSVPILSAQSSVSLSNLSSYFGKSSEGEVQAYSPLHPSSVPAFSECLLNE